MRLDNVEGKRIEGVVGPVSFGWQIRLEPMVQLINDRIEVSMALFISDWKRVGPTVDRSRNGSHHQINQFDTGLTLLSEMFIDQVIFIDKSET